MAVSKTDVVKFSLLVDSNAAKVAGDAATSVQGLAETIKRSNESIKDMQAELRNLRGNSDQVANAKEGLKAKLDAARNAISNAEIGLRKLGTSSTELAKADRALKAEEEKKNRALEQSSAKKAEAETRGLAQAIRTAGGPVSALKDRLDSLKEVLGGGGKAGVALGLAGVATLAVAGAAAIGTLASKIAGLASDAGRFVIVSANAAIAAQLTREEYLGNAKDAAAMGSQIDRLAGKVPRTKAQLNELAQSLAQSGLSGRALVDSLEAASAAPDALQGKIKGILESAKLTKRITLNRPDLVGTGLSFDDVAKELATSMKVGIDDAKRALASGTVSVGAGADALKKAVNKRFGEINARKMLDLNFQADRFKDRLANLASGVKLEPLLKALDSMGELLDESTVTGKALKDLVTAFGDELVGGIKEGTPIAKAFFKGMIVAALDLGTEYYKLKKGVKDAFSGSSLDGAKALEAAMVAGKVATLAATSGLFAFAGSVALGYRTAKLAATPFVELYDTIDTLYRGVKTLGWSGLGTAVVDGFVEGIKGGFASVKGALEGMGESAKAALKRSLGIASPSKVFREYGRNTGDGFAMGVEDSRDTAASAVAGLGTAPVGGASSASGVGASASAGAKIEVNIHIQAGSGANAEEIAQKLLDRSVHQVLAREVERALYTGGMQRRAA